MRSLCLSLSFLAACTPSGSDDSPDSAVEDSDSTIPDTDEPDLTPPACYTACDPERNAWPSTTPISFLFSRDGNELARHRIFQPGAAAPGWSDEITVPWAGESWETYTVDNPGPGVWLVEFQLSSELPPGIPWRTCDPNPDDVCTLDPTPPLEGYEGYDPERHLIFVITDADTP